MTGYVLNLSSDNSPDSQSKDQEINSMLKEVGLSHILDALDHECETRDHQRYEVLECAAGIKNSRASMFITKEVKSDEGSTDQ